MIFLEYLMRGTLNYFSMLIWTQQKWMLIKFMIIKILDANEKCVSYLSKNASGIFFSTFSICYLMNACKITFTFLLFL